MKKSKRCLLLMAFAILFSANATAQEKTAQEIYDQRIETAREEYRGAIARQFQTAEVVELSVIQFDGADSDGEDPFVSIGYGSTGESRGPLRSWFPIGSGRSTPVLVTKTLKAAEAKELLEVLGKTLARPKSSVGAYCHFPVHGICVYGDAKADEESGREVIFSGTFCWVCENTVFSYPHNEGEQLAIGKDLEKVVNKLLPIPKSELERFYKKYPKLKKSK